MRFGLVALAGALVCGCMAGPSDGAQGVPSIVPTQGFASPATEQPPGNPEPLTDEEFVGLSGMIGQEPPANAPPPVIDEARAEELVRSEFRGKRALIDVRRVTMALNSGTVTGYMVALTPPVGGRCSFNSGFLSRPIEGAIINDQTGDRFWIFGCPESLH